MSDVAAPQREGLKNTQMFNSQGTGPSVWVGGGSTKTKPAPTLFVTMIPHDVNMIQVKALFEDMPGFIAVRSVRRMIFVDFTDTVYATNAMRLHQGHKFRNHENSSGIAIDYDKDPVKKRNREFGKQQKQEAEAVLEANLRSHYCALCRTKCFKLCEKTKVSALPCRRTDKSHVVWDEAKLLRDLRVCKGATLSIKREKGVERQYRLNCTSCDVCLVYRPVPLEKPTRFMYVLPGAVVEDKDAPAPTAAAAAAADTDTPVTPAAAARTPPPPPTSTAIATAAAPVPAPANSSSSSSDTENDGRPSKRAREEKS